MALQRPHALALLLGAPLLLALLQSQLLLRRPGRLLSATSLTGGAATATLRLRFSRPLLPGSLLQHTRLGEGERFQASGEGTTWQLQTEGDTPPSYPIGVSVGARNQRGEAIVPADLRWDPRPLLVVVATRGDRERLELRDPQGQWRPLTPWLKEISGFLPLPDGSGMAYSGAEDAMRQRNWLVRVGMASTWSSSTPPPQPDIRKPRSLPTGSTLYSHFSGSRNGDLLIQGDRVAGSGPIRSSQPFLTLIRSDGSTLHLDIEAAGPVTLLPGGDGLVIPEGDGLALQTLPPLRSRRQFLPGRRDLLSFCGTGQMALLSRRNADFTRTLELLSPGQAPRRLWQGKAAVLAATCDARAQRIWVLTTDDRIEAGGLRSRMAVLEVNPDRGLISSTPLPGWKPASDASTLSHDPAVGELLTVLQRSGDSSPQPVLLRLAAPGQPLRPRGLEKPVRGAAWLVRR